MLKAEAILRVAAACKKTRKICGISGGVDISFWLQNGFQFVTASGDNGLMLEGLKLALDLATKKAQLLAAGRPHNERT